MLKKVIFLFIILILVISCRKPFRPTLSSLGTPPTDPDSPVIDEKPEVPEESYIVKADDTEEEIEKKIQKYYEENQKYAVIVEDSKENIEANNTLETINTIISKDNYSQGVLLDLINTDITTIKENAFKDNANLLSIKLPDTLTTIGNYAFNNCNKLQTVNFPSSLTAIGNGAFLSCKSLVEVNLKYVKINILSAQIFSDCTNLSTVILPDVLLGIENSAFAYCYSLKEIDFPKSLTIIGPFSFTECGFERLILNEGLVTIDNMVFYKCKSLKQISLPSTLTKIGTFTFTGCTGLFDIEYNGDNPLSIQAMDIFKSYAGAEGSTPQALYLPNVENPDLTEVPSQDPNPWESFLGYDWANKIQYKTSMPSN